MVCVGLYMCARFKIFDQQNYIIFALITILIIDFLPLADSNYGSNEHEMMPDF